MKFKIKESGMKKSILGDGGLFGAIAEFKRIFPQCASMLIVSVFPPRDCCPNPKAEWAAETRLTVLLERDGKIKVYPRLGLKAEPVECFGFPAVVVDGSKYDLGKAYFRSLGGDLLGEEIPLVTPEEVEKEIAFGESQGWVMDCDNTVFSLSGRWTAYGYPKPTAAEMRAALLPFFPKEEVEKALPQYFF